MNLAGYSLPTASCSAWRCDRVDPDGLVRAVDRMAGTSGFFDFHLGFRPGLFAPVALTITPEAFTAMARLVSAVEGVVRLPAYRSAVSTWAPAALHPDRNGAGLFMGYDFHLTEDGPRLIEVNTNAGGAFLCAAAAEAACRCLEGDAPHERFERDVIRAFRKEWWIAGRKGPLRSVAVIDHDPYSQYLFPEFELAVAMLRRNGFEAAVGAPAAVPKISPDIVYNRTTDFELEDEATEPLRAAYVDETSVVSPSPRHHALYADKRNLTLLSDEGKLRDLGANEHQIDAIRIVPPTRIVRRSESASLWADRKSLFFKPAARHASKGAYRGDKITRKTFDAVLSEPYVAQALVPPSTMIVSLDGIPAERKIDIRLYTHAGRILLAAARLYQGQTTNMRTLGGGFAPVFVGGA